MSKILDAVSVVLTCGAEVFVIERQYFLKSFPGYWAFPGGKVEADDRGDLSHPLLSGLPPRLWGALVRELQEELGIDVAALLARGEVSSVHGLGVAVTPDFNPYRFATYFFRIHLAAKPTFIIDRNEARSALWVDPKLHMQRVDRGEILAVPPVVKVFRALAENIGLEEIADLNFQYDPQTQVPMIESLAGVRQFMPRSHTLPPASRTNCFHVGDSGAPQILIDPSPCDRTELELLFASLRDFSIDAVMLTHHHGDHHEHAPDLARHYNVPILMSEDSHQRLLRIDPDYFSGIEVRHLTEGDVVSQWQGSPLRVVAVPGHDEGQLALMPDNRGWFLAGDLFQGIGTVVVGDEEGDMAKYMATLEKVIALSPAVIFPSHGIGLGSTFILQKTLEHRREREGQILRLHRGGKSEDEILRTLYSDIPAGLLPYARKNIRSHLVKILKEMR